MPIINCEQRSAGLQNLMGTIQYSEFMGVTVLAIILILRGCFFLFVLKGDPIKTIIPKLPKWPKTKEEKDKELAGPS